MSYGFLFDIDGCLTVPGNSISVLDVDVMDDIHELANTYPVAFATGRSVGWLNKHYAENNRLNYWTIPNYLEFGLVIKHNDNTQINQDAEWFLEVKEEIISKFSAYCTSQDIYFEEKTYDDYPDHDSLWVENKFTMLSIAANTGITPQDVHQITETVTRGISTISVLNHHLGVDILPLGWSKAKATAHYIENHVKDADKLEWMVFGDNPTDRDMQKPLKQSIFIDTKDGASITVKSYLISKGFINDNK